MKNGQNFCLSLLWKTPAISPVNRSLFFIKFSESILSLILIFYVPLNISFQIWKFYKNSTIFQIFFFYVPLITYLIDIIINFNLGFYQRGSLIMNKVKICKHYFLNSFFLDIFSLFFLIMTNDSILQIFFLLKTFKFFKFLNYFSQSFVLSEKVEAYNKLYFKNKILFLFL